MKEQPAVLLPRIHTVGDVAAQAGFVLGPRTIGDYELVYFPEGTNTVYTIGEEAYVLKSPCYIFTRPGVIHSYQFDKDRDVRHLFVHFDYMPLSGDDPRYRLLGKQSYYAAEYVPFLNGLMNQLIWIANRGAEHWRRRLSVLMAAALEEMASYEESVSFGDIDTLPVQLQLAIAYMEDHLHEPVTIEAVAEATGWSHEHFTRVFTRTIGLTPKRMLLEKRLQRAEELMLKGAMTVKQIAYTVGFQDEHHFSKIYKQIRGMTASEYMRRCNSPLFRHTAEPARSYSLLPTNRVVLLRDRYEE